MIFLFVVGLVRPASSWSLQASYSAFSNLVAVPYIGTPSRPIRVSLDFSTTDSQLYDGRTDCPAFVGECYDPPLSYSFSFHRACLEGLSNWSECDEAADLIQMTSESETNTFRFKLLKGGRFTGPAMREVAGVLGMSRQSIYFQTHEIALSFRTQEGRPGVFFYEPANTRERTICVPIIEEFESDWVFESHLRVGDAVLSPESNFVRFDPNAEELKISEEMEFALLSALQERGIHATAGFVDCDADPSLELVVGSGELRIRISSEMIVDKSRPLNGVCRMRYVVAPIGNIPIIGRQLLESVSEIVLSKNSISLISGEQSQERKWIPTVPLIPIFSPDFSYSISQGSEPVLTVEFGPPRVMHEGFFLWQTMPRELMTDEELTIESYMFRDTTGGGPSGFDTRTMKGSWSLSRIGLQRKTSFVFEFMKDPTGGSGPVTFESDHWGTRVLIVTRKPETPEVDTDE
jgi:hypothetical protein